MAVVNLKDVQKEFNLAIRHFRTAIKLAKKNLIVGQINFEAAEKKPRARKVKVTKDPENLPDADKEGYMLPRGKEKEAL